MSVNSGFVCSTGVNYVNYLLNRPHPRLSHFLTLQMMDSVLCHTTFHSFLFCINLVRPLPLKVLTAGKQGWGKSNASAILDGSL